jgi:hypothetical protein
MDVVLRMSVIWTKLWPFNKISEMISEMEKQPSMKVSDILHVWPVNIL